LGGDGLYGPIKPRPKPQEAVVRLTSAVEHIATQLEVMHLDHARREKAEKPMVALTQSSSV
jgi:hypothetical protein